MAVGIAVSFVMNGKINAHPLANQRFQKMVEQTNVCAPVKFSWKCELKLAGELCIRVFLAPHNAVPKYFAIRKLRRGMFAEKDLTVYNTLLFSVVTDPSGFFIFQLFSASISSAGNGRLSFAAAVNFD